MPQSSQRPLDGRRIVITGSSMGIGEAGGYIGQFHKNGDQLLGFKNHAINPPWTLDEIKQKLAKPALQRPDEIFQVLGTAGPLRLAIRQPLLVKLGSSALAQWWINRNKPTTGS